MGDGGRGSTTARTRLVVAIVGVVLLVLLAVLLPRLGGDDESSGAGTPSATTAPNRADEEPSDAEASGEPDDGAPSPSSAPSEGSGSPGDSGAPEEDRADDRPALRVSIDEPVRPTDALTVTVAQVEEVRSQAELPGETSRPALRLTVRVENTGAVPVSLGSALTNLYYGPERTPGSPILRPGGKPFPSEVAPGRTVQGVFVFNVPTAARARVVLEVILDAAVRRVEFSGNCSSSC